MLKPRQFWAELKQRLLSDNSELLHGEADIFVTNLKHRDAEKELAIIEAYKILLLPEICQLGINQIILFTKKGGWFVERIESNQFSDETCHKTELSRELLSASESFKSPKFKGFGQENSLPPTKIRLLERAIPV
ncbi:hypothetical protein ACE1CI_03255 [Aerosakkonemataceae cyanobacterium BLCC-F50]|uniref:Uncharacterized protein n=1 Tax=Floridaenema flaviceps BLCC-F50 TaxID=3153642 RepID=A0ABV4XJT6_9CYAN